MSLLFELPETPSVAIIGEETRFPVRRVFCVGRNYEAHAREMGFAANREAPIWFTKTPTALCPSGATIPYPPGTANCHYEMEFVVAIDAPAFRIAAEEAMGIVMGYACGFDMTRRDLQNASRDKGYPWDTGKDFENAAVIAPITRAAAFGEIGGQRITLSQNGTTKQDGTLAEMIWSVPELIADLSRMYHLAPGDLIYTGTPAGVGPVAEGDVLEGRVEGLEPVRLAIGPAE
ncbi:fumarylacetoacetate hydrolase family protein [Novosphingobium mangrovi (ex Huang et al. 2023)]|uniref:Fumarylacetoacetate hydrolase family protein n=1 Tax=Novosphingobium mangrovi (ex Huang et al. 2023) TaxID=2976432 RepID=A0ABT2HZJ5_9SPHN|nr:fumarylacetoacetate hydrolase family protein [Novosphingobium mangrovi (ex Huang et al. 2023)]MCT2397974.1 fumarylacetoacetate hydrolase family protein [Novosphingobium mangrovi (ex Huang et al. 2023)]